MFFSHFFPKRALFFFFFIVFGGHTCPFLGPLVPLFWISGDISSGFQSQSGLPYSHCGGERNIRSPTAQKGLSTNEKVAGVGIFAFSMLLLSSCINLSKELEHYFSLDYFTDLYTARRRYFKSLSKFGETI